MPLRRNSGSYRIRAIRSSQAPFPKKRGFQADTAAGVGFQEVCQIVPPPFRGQTCDNRERLHQLIMDTPAIRNHVGLAALRPIPPDKGLPHFSPELVADGEGDRSILDRIIDRAKGGKEVHARGIRRKPFRPQASSIPPKIPSGKDKISISKPKHIPPFGSHRMFPIRSQPRSGLEEIGERVQPGGAKTVSEPREKHHGSPSSSALPFRVIRLTPFDPSRVILIAKQHMQSRGLRRR